MASISSRNKMEVYFLTFATEEFAVVNKLF